MTLLEAALRNFTEKGRPKNQIHSLTDKLEHTLASKRAYLFVMFVLPTVLGVWESTREKFSRIVPMPNYSVREPPGKRHAISAP